MTLGRMLLVAIILILILTLSASVVVNTYISHQRLAGHMADQAQQIASAIGPALAAVSASGGALALQRMVDEFVGSGCCRAIIVADEQEQTLAESAQEVSLDAAPGWFLRWLPAADGAGSARFALPDGRVAMVTVHTHPGPVYARLWRDAVTSLSWILALLVLAALAAGVLLWLLLAPLRVLERQAEALSRREFEVNARLPLARDLRRVAGAMNHLSGRAGHLFREQADIAEHLRAEAYSDTLTGTENRRSFLMRLAQMTSGEDETREGAMLLVRIAGLDEVNKSHGFARGDQMLSEAALVLRDLLKHRGSHALARLDGAGFGILLPDSSPSDTEEVARAITVDLPTVREPDLPPLVCHVGAAYYTGSQSPTQLLAEADMALRKAQVMGPNTWFGYAPGRALHGSRALGAEAWRERIERVLAERQLVLLFQPVKVLQSGEVSQHEVFSRIAGEGADLVPAAEFFPMAERLGLSPAFDQLVLRTLVEAMASGRCPATAIAVNISPESVADRTFADGLAQMCKASPGLAGRLILEVSEYGVMHQLRAYQEMVARLGPMGIGFSIDRFGAGSPTFGYLHGLPLDNIKIDGSYIRGIHRDKDNQFFVRSLTDIAHGLDMRILASFVETGPDMETLKVLGVDAVQGYFVGAPEALAATLP